ncbi:MAG: hypothetical protein IH986_16985, partial [Planctomycetes bacterium]|nr:hypothetical protein [Planctomycetota bacterium]
MRTGDTAKTTTGLMILCVLHFVGLPPAAAQFSAHNVSLYSWIDLSTFGATSGNDCWGYVSPAGREYALMGVRNKVAFV